MLFSIPHAHGTIWKEKGMLTAVGGAGGDRLDVALSYSNSYKLFSFPNRSLLATVRDTKREMLK